MATEAAWLIASTASRRLTAPNGEPCGLSRENAVPGQMVLVWLTRHHPSPVAATLGRL